MVFHFPTTQAKGSGGIIGFCTPLWFLWKGHRVNKPIPDTEQSDGPGTPPDPQGLVHLDPSGLTPLDDPSVRSSIAGIAGALTHDPHLREDLIQQAFLHFLIQEQLRPGQTRSWYLQSCRYFLQNYILGGRSLDALKPCGRAVEIIVTTDEEEEAEPEVFAVQEVARSLAAASDILQVLGPRLNATQRSVLQCRFQGLSVQETADSLGVSHQAVTSAQRVILKIALRIGIAP